MRSVLTFAVVLLVAVSAMGQVGRIPSHMVSASTNALDNLGWGGTGTVAEVLEWIDSNWPTNIDVGAVYLPSNGLEGAVLGLWPSLDTNTADDFTATAASNLFLAATNVGGGLSLTGGVLSSDRGLVFVDRLEARCDTWTNTAGGSATTTYFAETLPWTVVEDVNTGGLTWANGVLAVPAGTNYEVIMYADGAVYVGVSNIVNASVLKIFCSDVSGLDADTEVVGVYDRSPVANRALGAAGGVMYAPTSRVDGATFMLGGVTDIGGTASVGLWFRVGRLGAVLYRRN